MMDNTSTPQIHFQNLKNGNTVGVSDLVNDEVYVRMLVNAGTAIITTEIKLSEEAARELGRLLVKHHDKKRINEEFVKQADMYADLQEKDVEIYRLKKEIDKQSVKSTKRKEH